MKLIFLVFSGFFLSSLTFAQVASKYQSNQTYTYSELIQSYQELENNNPIGNLIEVGFSDIGKPIHIFVIDKDKKFTPIEAKKSGKTIVFINNGIHSGEACGIDASVELARDLLNPKTKLHKSLDSVIVVIIPIYNIGGMLNRGAYTRANQNGPEEHGFRGNAKNLDLNRDFIKVDSRNAMVFTNLFRTWDPDVFVDTHTTNGSDHQYTLTLIATQKDKLNPVLAEYMQGKMLPELYAGMKQKDMEMTPYVYATKGSPDKGIMAFLETPRYSSGYAALFDCFSFITEAHVFKTFESRVVQTKGFLETLVQYSANHSNAIKKQRRLAKEASMKQKIFTLKWKPDTVKIDQLNFKGYETIKRKSEVTDLEMTFYDTEKPYEKEVPFYNSFLPEIQVEKANYYIVPQAYEKVIERLVWNKVDFTRLIADTNIAVSTYYIVDLNTANNPYESHFIHSNIKVEKKLETNAFYKGDVLVSTHQEAVRYIVETLEPQSVDGFFAWNFFDGVLQQKEWFSDYAFEPKALKVLEADAKLKSDFEAKKKEDTEFAKSSFAQLYYIYKRSPYYEKTVNRYPVYRIE